MKKANFYRKIVEGAIECKLCHHFCVIKNGAVGTCRARKNIEGELYSLVYGRPVAVSVDPIEKKPFYHFLPGSFTYSIGTLGCNFRCANCQNWDISQAGNIEKSVDYIEYVPPEKIVADALKYKCESIAYTYNEPTIFTEYALDIMKQALKKKLKNVWVSNGYMSNECLEEIMPYLDAINVDLKSIDDSFYQKYCGVRLGPVLENLKKLSKNKIHTEITTLIIPTLSDDEKMLKKLAKFIAEELRRETVWHISRFSPEISWKLKDLPRTEFESLKKAYEIGKKAGVKNVYVGNISVAERRMLE